jgi:DNA-binding NarL/FixJ family response regulator
LQNQLTIECDLPPYLIRVLVSVEALSPREHEVLQLMARGLKNKEIAAELIIGERTVKFHVSSILGKLGAGNRTEAVTMALQQGLIEQ